MFFMENSTTKLRESFCVDDTSGRKSFETWYYLKPGFPIARREYVCSFAQNGNVVAVKRRWYLNWRLQTNWFGVRG
jgi:hypothetical protein